MISVRLVEPRDAEPTRAIYNLEVEGSIVTFDLVPRTREQQVAWIAEHQGVHPAVVAVDETDDVVGFGSLSPYRERPAYRTTVEDSVYVHRDRQGQGIGRAILAELVTLGQTHGFHTIMARVVGGHAASIAVHRRCGFDVVGTEREVGRKLGRWLDVVLMQRML